MKIYDWIIGACLLLFCCGQTPACVPAKSTAGVPGQVADESLLIEFECESQMLILKNLLELQPGKSAQRPPAFIEAVELLHLSESLFLQKQFDMALEFIERAFAILEERSY